ncbi:phage holin family protein [Streptomyces zagrosensis]|uniref:Putative membrane protein YqjE n=1 Tax=Streptomyces zagrosensis TaxID=1042984 RepID=A0A7W9QDR7_9ACTN|nr:phage holin family protein [Streptomyces zagrosensis]MBB5938395.1 putative membrane protein YqjE [Streptomyces zagrosensis]
MSISTSGATSSRGLTRPPEGPPPSSDGHDPYQPLPYASASFRRERDRSLGELMSEVTSDMQQLLRQEVELAKAEVREEATKAGKAAGMFGGAGFAGYMVVVLLSLTAVFALANVMDLAWAALIVTAIWAVVAAVLFMRGRSQMRNVSPKPEHTMETLKEDARWARHPIG